MKSGVIPLNRYTTTGTITTGNTIMIGVITSTDISSRSIVTIAEVDMTGTVTDAAAMDGEGEAEVVTATAAVIGDRQ